MRAENILRAAGLRRTPGRLRILRILSKASRPMTQEHIAGRLGKKGLDKATIYRALKDFVRAGLVHKVFLQRRSWHFELAQNCSESQCHPHFTCKKCAQTRCLTETSAPMVRSLRKGFVVHRQEIRLEGLCPECGGKKDL